MKTKQLLPQTVYAIMLGAAMLLGSCNVFAQVKIGTNPTTIEPNSNLEVEASTAGRKMKVDKTTGQVTITDGTEGAGKVLTSNAVGGATWQYPLSGAMTEGTTGNLTTVTDPSAVHTYSGATITLPRAGTYMVSARWFTLNPVTTFTTPNTGFVNTALSTSSSTDDLTGVAAEWLFLTHGMHHTTPSFRVTVSGPQTLYFWFYTGFFTGQLQLAETYAIGPF